AAERTDESGNRHILFPEKFSAEKLDALKAQMGTAAYNCLYLNDPSGQEGADFKLVWIESGRYDRPPDNLTVFAGIDLAIGRREANSRFAYCVIGLDKAGTAYILEAFRGRLPFDEQLKTVKRLHRIHGPRLITVETNGFQAAFLESLRTDPETRLLPLRGVTTQGDKQARLRGLTPLFESGAIRLPRADAGSWVAHLEEELLHFPQGTEDMIDALWMSLQGVEMQRVEPRIVYVEDLA
ncbi:MAG: phage terminase large subunit, partial [Elusimicrobia bacterium]|nr:phage terminase large subunit [Elusimicrobiota bacterium]